MFRYTLTALELKGKFAVYSTVIMNILLIPALLACFVNIFVPLYFSVDDSGVYRREPLFMLSQTYLAIGLNIVIICFFISKVNIKDRLIVGSFVMIPVAHQIITRYAFGITTEFSAMLVSVVLIFGVIVAKREKKLLKTEKKLYESKISVMVSQIQPHFMYNALTSIAMMCTIDPNMAQEATITFAKYLRGNMDSLKQKTPVPFSQELEHLKKYLYIEKLRFGDKLNVEYDITAENFVIPLLSVQPLVENAVKHGVGMKKKGGTVTISSKETENAYEVIISDDGVGFDTSAPRKQDGRSHVGMDNTRMRLHEMCGGEVIIESTIDVGTTARIILPKEEQNHENTMS
jgi:sensor histidine kinase YesM